MKAKQSYDNGSSGKSFVSKWQLLWTPIIQKITENWGVKAICIAVAVIIYLFYQMSLVKTQVFVIPLSVDESGGVEHVGNIQNSVKVTVRAKSDTNLHSSDFSAKLDLDYYTQSGTYDVPVELEISNDLIQVDPVEIKIKPEKIPVHVEKRISTAVPVETILLGSPAHGFEIIDYSVTPNQVIMSGPESIINQILKVSTYPVRVEGLAASKQFNVGLEKLNRMINLEDDVEWTVNVQVAPIISQIVKNNVSPVLKNKSPDFEYTSLSRDLTVTFTGPMVILENMDDDAIFFNIDLTSIQETGEYVFPININLPKQVTVTEKSFTDWKIQAVKKEVEPVSELDAEDNMQASISEIEES